MLRLMIMAMMAISFNMYAAEESPDLQLENGQIDYWQYQGLKEPMLDEELSKNIPPIADVIDVVAHGHVE